MKILCLKNVFIKIFFGIMIVSVNTMAQTVLFEDDFEVGSPSDYNFVNWTHGSKPNGGWYPVLNSEKANTGSQCVSWTAKWETYMESVPIDTSGTDKIVLKFFLAQKTGESYSDYPYFLLSILYDNDTTAYPVYQEDALLGGYSGTFYGTNIVVHSSEGTATGDFFEYNFEFDVKNIDSVKFRLWGNPRGTATRSYYVDTLSVVSINTGTVLIIQ